MIDYNKVIGSEGYEYDRLKASKSLVIPDVSQVDNEADAPVRSIHYDDGKVMLRTDSGFVPIGGDSVDISSGGCTSSLEAFNFRLLKDGATDSKYYAFPAFTKTTQKGTILLGYYKGDNHTSNGVAAMMRSTNYGLTWGDEMIIEPDSAINWRCFIPSLLGDTLFATTWTEDGRLFFYTSDDDGLTWSARTEFTPTAPYAVAAIEGHAILFNGKWYVPFYSYAPSTIAAGVLVSDDEGATWSVEIIPNSGTLQLSEGSFMIQGDSLVYFLRSETYELKMYRTETSGDGTWSTPAELTLPENRAGRPSPFLMPDGRVLMNYRVWLVGQTPAYQGKVAISTDGGYTFTQVHHQHNTGQWMYGDIIYLGGDDYLNVFAHDVYDSGMATRASLYQEYWSVPSCEVRINNTLVKLSSSPIVRSNIGSDDDGGDYIANQITFPQPGNAWIDGEIKAALMRSGSLPNLGGANQFTLVAQQGVAAMDNGARAAYLLAASGLFALDAYDYSNNAALTLHINLGTLNTIINKNGGKVGIGTDTPAEKLHVVGNARISSLAGTGTRSVSADENGNLVPGSPGGSGIDNQFVSPQEDANFWIEGAGKAGGGFYGGSLPDLGGASQFTIIGQQGVAGMDNLARTVYLLAAGGFFALDAYDYQNNTGLVLHINLGAQNTLINRFGGNVGIGTDTPAEKLHIGGNVRISGLAGTGTKPVGADANGKLVRINNDAAVRIAADEDLTITDNDEFITLPEPTADRQIIIPAASARPGRKLIFRNKTDVGHAFEWSFSAGVWFNNSVDLLVVPPDQVSVIQSDGDEWVYIGDQQ